MVIYIGDLFDPTDRRRREEEWTSMHVLDTLCNAIMKHVHDVS